VPDREEIAEYPQKYFQKLACFQTPENMRRTTTLMHPITTNSPQKYQQKTPTFPKTTLKTRAKSRFFDAQPRQNFF
jgi:hypothetical protein